MWYPSRSQWLVIWLTTVVALALWIGGAPFGRGQDRAAVAVVLLGALLVWQLAAPRRRDATATVVVGSAAPAGFEGWKAGSLVIGALALVTFARGVVSLVVGLAAVLHDKRLGMWFGGMPAETWSPLVDAGLLLLLGVAVEWRHLWAAYGIALYALFEVVGKTAGIVTSTQQAIGLSVALATLCLAIAGTVFLVRVKRREDAFRLDVPFLAKWFALTVAVGFVGGFAGSFFRDSLGGEGSLGAQMPLRVAGFLQLVLFIIATSRKPTWGLEHLLLIVALMLPLDAVAMKPERTAWAQWFGTYMSGVERAFIAWGVSRLLPRPVPKVPALAVGAAVAVAILAAWGLGVRFREVGKLPAQAEIEAQMQRAVEQLEREGRLPRAAAAAQAFGAMLVGEGFKHLADDQLAKVLRLRRAILDLTDQESCAAMWERGLPSDVANALLRYLPEPQQREWAQVVGVAIAAETNGVPPKRERPDEAEVEAAFRTLFSGMPSADAADLRSAFDKSGTLPTAAACRATRLLYGRMAQLPTTPAVLILRASLYN